MFIRTWHKLWYKNRSRCKPHCCQRQWFHPNLWILPRIKRNLKSKPQQHLLGLRLNLQRFPFQNPCSPSLGPFPRSVLFTWTETFSLRQLMSPTLLTTVNILLFLFYHWFCIINLDTSSTCFFSSLPWVNLLICLKLVFCSPMSPP